MDRSGAPVAVFAFRRLDLLKRVLAALERSEGFRESPVVVFSDAARDHVSGEAAEVERLREWVRRWCVRWRAELVEAQENQGLRASITAGVARVVQAYGRVIVLEDDIVVSRGFLRFMNEGLALGEERGDLYQVSGYFVPHRDRLPAVGLLRMPSCWGWATWKRAWECYDDDAAGLYERVGRADVRAFDINGSYANFDALRRNAVGELNTWFVRWYASIFLRGGFTLYPAVSLTRNIGFGGGGTHCEGGRMNRVYLRQRIDPRTVAMSGVLPGAVETPEYLAALEGFYRWQNLQWAMPGWRERVKSKLRRMLGS